MTTTSDSGITTVRVSGPDALAKLLTCPSMLLDVTFDQLRTLVVVHEAGSAYSAARLLGREQSSVQKQIDSLNRSFQRMCGELLAVKQGRGQPFLFTPSGTAVAGKARALLVDWQAEINDARRRIGKTLTVGTTEFTLNFLGRAWERVAERFQARRKLICFAVASLRFPEATTFLPIMSFSSGSVKDSYCSPTYRDGSFPFPLSASTGWPPCLSWCPPAG
jgi:hypothetical protein